MANPFITHPDLASVLANPAPTAEEPTEPTSPPQEPEPTSAPAPDDIAAQKYGSDNDALRKGYNEQFHETQRILDERRQMSEQLRVMQEAFLRSQPPQPNGKSPADELLELGINPSPVERLIDARVAERLGGLERMARAQQELMYEIPDFTQRAPELHRFLAGNPELQREYNELAAVNPKAASKYVYREYEARNGNRPRQSAADVGLNRTNASIPTTQAGARAAPERDWGKELEQARIYSEQTGDDRPYWKLYWQAQGKPLHPSFQADNPV
jgi:hypothetical protein